MNAEEWTGLLEKDGNLKISLSLFKVMVENKKSEEKKAIEGSI